MKTTIPENSNQNAQNFAVNNALDEKFEEDFHLMMQDSLSYIPIPYTLDEKTKALLGENAQELMIADGNCFWRGIANFKHKDQTLYKNPKEATLKYLEDNVPEDQFEFAYINLTVSDNGAEPLILPTENISLMDQKTEVLNYHALEKNKYADEFMIFSASKALKLNIVVFSESVVTLYLPDELTTETCAVYHHKEIREINAHRGPHYDALKLPADVERFIQTKINECYKDQKIISEDNRVTVTWQELESLQKDKLTYSQNHDLSIPEQKQPLEANKEKTLNTDVSKLKCDDKEETNDFLTESINYVANSLKYTQSFTAKIVEDSGQIATNLISSKNEDQVSKQIVEKVAEQNESTSEDANCFEFECDSDENIAIREKLFLASKLLVLEQSKNNLQNEQTKITNCIVELNVLLKSAPNEHLKALQNNIKVFTDKKLIIAEQLDAINDQHDLLTDKYVEFLGVNPEDTNSQFPQ